MWEFSCSSLKEKEDKWLKGPGVRLSACGRVCGRSRDLAGGWSLVWYKGWRETGLGGAGTSWEEERHKEDVSGPKSCLLETESKYYWCWASLVAQMVKNRPETQETWIRSLGWENQLEKGMATYSSIFAWEIPWTEDPGQLQSMGSQRVRQDRVANTYTLWTLHQNILLAGSKSLLTLGILTRLLLLQCTVCLFQ